MFKTIVETKIPYFLCFLIYYLHGMGLILAYILQFFIFFLKFRNLFFKQLLIYFLPLSRILG